MSTNEEGEKDMSWLSNLFSATEAEIQTICVAFHRGFTIAETDVSKIANWIDNNIGQITSVVQEVLSVVQILGVTNPAVEAGVTAANSAVIALNQFVKDHQSGKSTAVSAVDAYSSFKAAQSAATGATALVLKAS